MDRVLIRNFLLFVVIMLGCVGTLMYGLIAGDREIDRTGDLVVHTYDVITEAEQLSQLIEGMLAAQRGFILTQSDRFIQEYEQKKSDVSEHIANLSELTDGNSSQQSRLDEIRSYFTEFSLQLESRVQSINFENAPQILNNIEAVDATKNNIMRINSSILREQYQILNLQIQEVERERTRYFFTLITSIIVGTLLLLIFNGFLLSVQRKRTRAEASLKDTEERYALAIEGTQDGIFDWDIKTNKVFYSSQTFKMLGYDSPSFVGTVEDFSKLLHPDDTDRVWAFVDDYLKGEISEYAQEFRLKHKSGRWVWVRARAKAIYDDKGDPYRLIGAHTDITHIKQNQHRLEREKTQAEEANKAKSEFLAHMSHEIRTPLTAITGIAEIFLKNQEGLNEKQRKLATTLFSSSASLKDLVNDVLDFSRIESGEIDLEKKTFNLDTLLQQVISMMALRANEKGVKFVFDCKAVEGHRLYGDESRLRQIIVNLVGNALKFTEKGEVKARAYFQERNGQTYFGVDVMDTGIGIAPENFDLIFERFKQADSSISRKYGGTGLGLPISRNLARLMGGDIQISSQLGKGSTFSLLIPSEAVEEDKSAAEQQEASKIDKKIKAIADSDKRLLVAEDYEGNVVVLSYILEDLGLAYDIASTGKQAYRLWEHHDYDLILMDIQMPDMDGITATQKIRRSEIEKNRAKIPIIGMTAHALIEDKEKCINAGMDSYISKPILESELKEKIYNHLKNNTKKAA